MSKIGMPILLTAAERVTTAQKLRASKLTFDVVRDGQDPIRVSFEIVGQADDLDKIRMARHFMANTFETLAEQTRAWKLSDKDWETISEQA